MYLFGTSTYIYSIIVANTLALFILGWWGVWGKARENSVRLGRYLPILGGVIYTFCAILTYQGVWLGCFLLLLGEKIISYHLRQREEQVSEGAVFGSKKSHSPQTKWSEVRLLLAQIGVYFVMRLVWVQP